MAGFSKINFDTCKIGFIGAGNMAMAIVKGLIKYGNVEASRIFVSAPSNRNLPKFEQLGCTTTNDNYDLVDDYECSIIFICVKPHHIISKISHFTELVIEPDYHHIILSTVAGVTLDKISKFFQPSIKSSYYRLMPNLACEVGKGLCAITESKEPDLDNCIQDFLAPIFTLHFSPENEFDKLTALNGSGFAFAMEFIQAMADGGVKIGLSRELAVEIATHTISGACAMVNETKKHPIELRDKVCSPAGTTIYGIHALHKGKFSSAVIDSVFSSYHRCNELKEPV